jgi:uncharacterized membrane protein
VAIVMMVVYHFTYDLDTFVGLDVDSTTGLWSLFADVTAFLFVFLVGVSLAISRVRAERRLGGWFLFRKYLLRGAKILGFAMALTAGSWALGIGVIAFGILHLIGVSIILAYPFLDLRLANLVLGAAVISAGIYVGAQELTSESLWLLPFGVIPLDFPMPDYRPLLPWFGVVLLGLFAGNTVYAGREGRPGTPAPARPLAFLGRHSLLIYLVHQPLLVAALLLLGFAQL